MIDIIGKNGAGKTTLANFLYDFGFERNIGYTTRPKRSGEIDGIDYYFVAEKEFKRKIINWSLYCFCNYIYFFSNDKRMLYIFK